MNKINYNYEKFFELTPDLLCIAGFDGYFKKVNAAVANTLGYSYEELYSSPINSFLHPLDVEMTNKVRASLTAFETLYNFENRYITKTGEIVWLSWTSRPSKEDRLIFASAKNISYRKRLELDKDNEFDNLVKINEAFKQLSYTTSHDLRSPLESLLAVFDLLDLNTIKDEKTIALINVLKRGGEKIKTRVDEYINTLNSAHEPIVNVDKVYFNEVLKTVLNSLNPLVENSRILIKSNFAAFDHVQFNQGYLESVFLNLISNAIKYRRSNILSSLTIYTEISQNAKTLIFEDNGMGFDMKEVEGRIFELNQTFHNHEDSKGIGLYLVKKHLQSLGAKIEVDSQLTKGTKFIITFEK